MIDPVCTSAARPLVSPAPLAAAVEPPERPEPVREKGLVPCGEEAVEVGIRVGVRMETEVRLNRSEEVGRGVEGGGRETEGCGAG